MYYYIASRHLFKYCSFVFISQILQILKRRKRNDAYLIYAKKMRNNIINPILLTLDKTNNIVSKCFQITLLETIVGMDNAC